MTSKTILVLAIAAAFVAGTMTSGTAFADHQPNHNPGGGGSDVQDQIDNLQALIDAQQAEIDALELLTASMTADLTNVYFTGVNVHIRDGTGSTDCAEGVCNTLGNLIVGYDEEHFFGSDKSGSHNLVVGPEHSYSSYGGFVSGFLNTVSGPHSSISGGQANTASGDFSSVSGGSANIAMGSHSSISGGRSNISSGGQSSVLGGEGNTASGDFSSVSGGSRNISSGQLSTVLGGEQNTASGPVSSISGGRSNISSGEESSISGGHSRTAAGLWDWVAGSLFQDQ